MEGWLEKKTASMLHMGGAGDWERIYCAVDEQSSALNFYSSASKSRSSLSSTVDMKLVSDVSAYFEKKGGPSTRFNLTMAGDKTLKFKTESVEERDRYVKLLRLLLCLT